MVSTSFPGTWGVPRGHFQGGTPGGSVNLSSVRFALIGTLFVRQRTKTKTGMFAAKSIKQRTASPIAAAIQITMKRLETCPADPSPSAVQITTIKPLGRSQPPMLWPSFGLGWVEPETLGAQGRKAGSHSCGTQAFAGLPRPEPRQYTVRTRSNSTASGSDDT